MISLLILLCGLFCTSSAMCYTSRHLTGVDQLRAQELANRQRTATPTTSSPTASKVVVINPQSEVGAIAPATTPAGRPPLPTIPPKSVDFTADQARYYDAFINLAPLLKDPKRFAKGADGVRNIIDGAIVGTNPCKIIAQRAELQQTVLAVIFAGLSKKALEQAALPADKLHDALDAGTKLHTVLNYEAWETMNIDANSALKPQSLNALDRLDDFRDQPVSPANAVTYHDFTAAATAAKHLNALEIAGGSEGMTPFFTSLMDNVQKMEDAHLADKSGEAQEAFLAAGKLQPPEQLNEADKKKLLNFAQNLREVAHRTMPLARRKIADEEATRITNDVLGKETPIDEMRDFARDLANALYQPGTNLASPDGPKKFKASFFAQPNNLKRLCTYLLRINTILTQAVTAQTSPLASPKAEKYLLPILWLPAEFFETIKTQLNANALTATDRDNFIVVMTGLLATFKHNALVFGIKSAYGSNSVESLAAATSQLTLASSQENETYRNIVDYTRAIKATLMEIIEKNSLPAATFLAPVDDAGKTLTYEAAVAKNKEILGEAKTPKEAYGKLINCLNKTLSSNKDIIITNEKIFTALLSQDSSLEPEDISVKVQKVLKPADVMATNMFFILQKGIRTQVATTAHKIFPTVAESIVQQEILGPCYEFLYDVYESMPGNPPILKDPATLKKDLFSSSDSIKQMVQRLTVFSNVVTQKGRPDIADALTNSAIVRYSLYIPPFLALSADFFAQARTISDDKTRYNISRYGYALIDTLLTLENGNETTTPALSTLRELFKSVGNTDKESALLATFQKNIAQINDAVKKIDTATGTEQQKMISAYTAGFKQIMTLIKDGDSRTFIGFNYAAHSLIFSDNGLFLTAVPAGLNSDGRQATSEFLHAVLDNPNDLNYADRPDRQQIETSMRDMIATLEKSDREAAHALPKEASDLSSLLNAAYINLKDMKTYQDGLMCIYSQMKNADTRKIVGKYKEIYNALFATTGVICIPTGIDIGKLDPTQIDPIT
ncbi:MAG: hypothetical protein QG604_121, partial [Candidatus Dependentiae bacterium]|nr:hypothetical protein [Candidatus Dependentiae bacterium]